MSTWVLWHPDSPGTRLLVRSPCLLRRLRVIKSPFATLGEVRKINTDYLPMFTDHPYRGLDLPHRL